MQFKNMEDPPQGSLPPRHRHQHQHQPYYYYYPQQATTRGVPDWRVPLLPHQTLSETDLPQVIPVDFRRRAIQYMSKRLQVGVTIEDKGVREIEKRILTLEEQVHTSSDSQDEYITKLASRLAAILQHIDKCRALPQASVPLQAQQQERVM
ncbi:hypothetical protein GWK47_015179 [Chionoecetes opilio]|uniref:Uncharacterized protein n=1 Tax=Chionoecetes opilio TaxID=41210 RepID=A0A8J4XU82_CHIOP|nr:hypothetical protein GWK47_015179 [Chionoecetes opilio]